MPEDNISDSSQQQFTVSDCDIGVRLDIYLTKVLSGYSRSQIQRLITEEKVLVNKSVPAKKTNVKNGDFIEITGRLPSRESNLIAQDVAFGIIYEDEHLVAVNKPAGLVVHPGSGVHDGTLVNGLLFRLQSVSDGFSQERPGIVHRLDKDTSGVLLVAKTNQAHTAMAALFQSRKIQKHYIGFCIGVPSQEHGIIELPLDRSHNDPTKRVPSQHGKEARTEYWVLRSDGGISAIHFKPYTGRTHQIRVHASAKGFPILADSLYGGGKERLLRVPPLERPFAHSILKCFSRHALHAFSISFIHPFSKEKIVITAPVPDDFHAATLRFGDVRMFDTVVPA